MKINYLLVANYPSDYGYAWWLMENFWVEIANYAEQNGARAFLIYPELRTISKTIQSSKLITAELPFAFNSRQKRKTIKEFIVNNNIGFIYLTDQKYLNSAYLLLKWWGVRKIIIHDHSPGKRDAPKFLRKIVKKAAHWFGFLSADHYIGVSQFVYHRFLHVGCIPEKKCSYVLNGIKPYENHGTDQHYARKQFDLPENAIIAVSTGRATIYKGIDFLIECADEIINSKSNAQKSRDQLYFVHCGDGIDMGFFRKLVSEKNLEGKFILAGQRSDIKDILLSSDIAVHASSGEAFSLSILEYMSAGLACIVPDNCGNNEAITDGHNGLLYETRNKEEFVNCLMRVVEDQNYRQQLGCNARKSVDRHFRIERANRELIHIIAAVTGSRIAT